MTTTRKSQIFGLLVVAFTVATTSVLLYGISVGSSFPVAMGISGGNTALLALGLGFLLPRENTMVIALVVLLAVLGGIQYAISWVI